MTDFKVGDRVRIQKSSRFYGISTSNPRDVVGVIIEDRRGGPQADFLMDFSVEWDNGKSNSYNVEDLELVKSKSKSRLTQFIKQWEKKYDQTATSGG